ncbi:MAG: hypothetical protein IBJ18_08305 [Phycisphaerales bacterium]|nr:hypothetical protein [Phycisphaerales bacterium]
MHSSVRKPARVNVRGIVLALGLMMASGGLVSLGGCDRTTEGQKALKKATEEMAVLTANGGGVSSNPEFRKKRYEEIQRTLASFRDSTETGIAPAAGLMWASATAGLGELEIEVAGQHDAKASMSAADALRYVSMYVSELSNAKAAGKVDVSKEQQALSNQRAEKTAELSKVSGELTKNQGQLDRLNAEAKRVMDEAKAKRRTALELRGSAEGKSATEGLEIVKKAAEVSREADALERKAGEISAKAGEFQSTVTDLTRAKESLEKTLKLIDDSGNALKAVQAQAGEVSRERSESASKIASDVSKSIAELNTTRQALLAALDGAAKKTGDALAAAKKVPATDSDAGSQKLAVATYSIQLAEIASARARDAARLARVLSSAANANPALPDGAALKDAAEKADQEALAAGAAAREAFENAKNSLDGISKVSESVKARLEALSLRLAALAENRAVATPAPTVTASSVGASAATVGAAESGDIAEVKRVVAQMQESAKAQDIGAFLSHINFDEKTQKAMSTMVGVSNSIKALDQVCSAKLNAGLEEAAGPLGGALTKMSGVKSFEGELVDELSDMTFKSVLPGQVEVTNRKGETQRFIKKGSQWLMNPPGDLPLGMIEQMSAFGTELSGAVDEIAKDVTAGKISTKEMLQQVLMTRLGPIFRKLGGGIK